MNARLYFWMGMTHELLDKYDEAAKAYGKAREIALKIHSDEVKQRLQHIRSAEPSRKPTYPPPAELQEERVFIEPFSEIELESFRKAFSEIETVSDLLRLSGMEG